MLTKDEEAELLAELHYQIEPGLTHVFRVTGPDDAESSLSAPIKLLEVNENTVPAGIMPLQFGPSPSSGFHFSSIILEVTPEEYEKIQSLELPLPDGWQIGDPIPKPPAGEVQ